MNQGTGALIQIADQIKVEYQAHQAALAAARQALSASLKHASQCGEYLLQAQAQLQAGRPPGQLQGKQWGRWLAMHLSLSEAAAHTYIEMARERNALPPTGPAENKENIPKSQAALLSADIDRLSRLPVQPLPWQDAFAFREQCRQSNDFWLTHLCLFEVMGKSVAEIARLTGHTIAQVEHALSPIYSDRFPAYNHGDDSSWNSLSVFFDADPAAVKTAYEWQRHSLVSFWLWAAKRSAAQVAARHGLDCVDELQVLTRAAQREKDRYSETQGGNLLARASRDPFFAALHACACEDARYAIGFDPVDRFDPSEKPIVIWVIEKMVFFQWLYDLLPAQRKQASPQTLLALAETQQAHPWVIETLKEYTHAADEHRRQSAAGLAS